MPTIYNSVSLWESIGKNKTMKINFFYQTRAITISEYMNFNVF